MFDLKTQALVFLDFIEDSVREAMEDPSSKLGCLTEADGALRCLKKVLRKRDDLLYAQLSLTPLFDFRFINLDEYCTVEQER